MLGSIMPAGFKVTHMLETTMAINSKENLSTQLPSFLKYVFYFKDDFQSN